MKKKKETKDKIPKHDTYEVNRMLISVQGEILGYIYENDEINVISPQEKSSNDYKSIRQKLDSRSEFEQLINLECGQFYFNFFNGGLLSMDIKESIKARFLFLCTYTNYSDKGLYLTHDNGKKMDRKGVAEVLSLSEREARNTIKTMLEADLLTKKGDYFVANEKIITRGKLTTKQSSLEHIRVFDAGMRELYKNCKPAQHKQLYYIFKLLPYVNIKFNIICQNPSEQDEKEIIPLNINEVCAVVDYDISNAKRLERDLYKLNIYDKLVVLGVQSVNGTFFKVNPRVYYGGTCGHINEFIRLLATDFDISQAIGKRKQAKTNIIKLKEKVGA